MSVENTVLLDGLIWPESPRWHDGRLWFSDIQGHRVIAMTVGAKPEVEVVAEFEDEPSGLGFLPDGVPLVVLRRRRALVRLENGRQVLHADLKQYSGPAVGYGEEPHDYMLNDMVVDANGRAYVDKFIRRRPGDAHLELGESIILVEPDGSHRVAAEDVHGPNGIAVTADGLTLILAEPPRLRLTVFTISSDGSLDDRRPFADLGDHRPDGICLDAEGGVWVACPNKKEAIRVLEGGEVTDRIATGDRGPLSCVLGDHDRRTLLMGTSKFDPSRRAEAEGFIEARRVEVAGSGRP